MPHASDPTSQADVAADRTSASPAAREARGAFVAQLHSLTGVAPLALFLVVHLVDQARRAGVVDDPANGETLSCALLTHPLVRVVVLASFAIHAAVGLTRIARARYDVRRNPTSRNWMYALQHVTGALALGFIVLHGVDIALPIARGQVHPADVKWELISDLSATQASIPWLALGYMVGMAVCAFHLGNGVWRFATARGLVVKRAPKQGLVLGCALLGLTVLGLGANTTVLLATGSALSWSDSETPEPDPALLGTACPDTSSRTPATASATVPQAPEPSASSGPEQK